MEPRTRKCIDCGKGCTRRALRCMPCGMHKKCSGKGNPMYGKENKWGHHTEAAKNKISLRNELHPGWKGEKAGIDALHVWVKRRKPKSRCCEKCKKITNRLELSNNSGKYLRDLGDYEWLCYSCHKRKDRGTIICPRCKKNNKYKNYDYCKECERINGQERYLRRKKRFLEKKK